MNKTKYTITSQKYKGQVIITFANSIVILFNAIEASLTTTQVQWFLTNALKGEEAFYNMVVAADVFTIVGEKEELTFEMFWNRYNEKTHSSKRKAQLKWNRMSKQQQILAYMHITAYFKSIPSGIAKKYAETYLNSEIWNN